MIKAKLIQQITLVPNVLDKGTGAYVHVSAASVILDESGKVYSAVEESAADLQLIDSDLVDLARQLRDAVAQRLADQQRTAVRASGDPKAELTQPAAVR